MTIKECLRGALGLALLVFSSVLVAGCGEEKPVEPVAAPAAAPVDSGPPSGAAADAAAARKGNR